MNNHIKEYGLNVHLLSFNISQDLIKGSEIIVNVSTRPEHFKDTISIPVEYCNNVNHIFRFNVKVPCEQTSKKINGQTDAILFSFRLKSKFGIKKRIAIASLHQKEFPIISNQNNEIKNINIYKTTKDQINEYYEDLYNGKTDKYEITENFTLKRISVGKIKIQLSLCESFENLESNSDFQSLKPIHEMKRNSKKYEKLF